MALGGNVIQFEGSSTNIISGQITLISGALTRSGYGSSGLNLIEGGVIGTNQTWSYYAGMGNALTITNKPVNLGAGGYLDTSAMIFNVGSNNIGFLNPQWSSAGVGLMLGVNNAFTNAPTLILGNNASVAALDLHGYGLVVGTLSNSTYTPASDWVTNSSGTAAILTVSNALNNVFTGSLGGTASGSMRLTSTPTRSAAPTPTVAPPPSATAR